MIQKLGKIVCDITKQDIIIFSTIQSEGIAKSVTEFINKNQSALKNKKDCKTSFGGRFVGCNAKLLSSKKASAFLFIGSGRFHALMLANSIIDNAIKKHHSFQIQGMPKIYTLSLAGKLNLIDYSKIIKTKKAKYFRFVNSKNIGTIISLKPGQLNMKAALNIKNKINKIKGWKTKKVYTFITDNIEIDKLQDYNINMWVTSACPGLSLDKNNIINTDEFNVFLSLLGH